MHWCHFISCHRPWSRTIVRPWRTSEIASTIPAFPCRWKTRFAGRNQKDCCDCFATVPMLYHSHLTVFTLTHTHTHTHAHTRTHTHTHLTLQFMQTNIDLNVYPGPTFQVSHAQVVKSTSSHAHTCMHLCCIGGRFCYRFSLNRGAGLSLFSLMKCGLFFYRMVRKARHSPSPLPCALPLED